MSVKVVEKRTLLRSPWLSTVQSQLTWCHTDNGQQRSASPCSCKGDVSKQQKPRGGATQARSCDGDWDHGCVHLGKSKHHWVWPCGLKGLFLPSGFGGIFWHSQQSVCWALELPRALLKAPRPSSGLDELGQETRGQEVELPYPAFLTRKKQRQNVGSLLWDGSCKHQLLLPKDQLPSALQCTREEPWRSSEEQGWLIQRQKGQTGALFCCEKVLKS